MSRGKILFIDLDECLLSSLYANNEKHANDMLYTYGEYWPGVIYQLPGDGWYTSFIRSWSRKLIKHFQMTLGLDNVYILSWGSLDYVLRSTHLLEMSVPHTNIYTREDIHIINPRFKNKNMVLVDNENYEYHRSGIINKVKFLHGLNENKLIQVPNFDVRYFRDDDDITIDKIIDNIEETFNYE